jgi:hypothetical protein
MQDPKLDPELAREAKAIVALAFRHGPIENLHLESNANMPGQKRLFHKPKAPGVIACKVARARDG